MKAKKLFGLLLAVVVLLAPVLSACSIAQAGGAEYNELIGLVQNVQASSGNFQLVTDTQYGKIQAITQQTTSYYQAVGADTEVWTGHFRSQADALTSLLKNYKDANGNPIDPSKLNLDQLLQQGAMPDKLGQGMALYVNAVVQAPPPQPDSKVTLALMDSTSEAMNTIQLAGTDYNNAVKAYNTRRLQIKGEVVAAVSKQVGFPLPAQFPYYSGGNTGPIKNPIAPVTAPTVAQ